MEKVAFNDEMTENTKVTVGSVAIIWQKIVYPLLHFVWCIMDACILLLNKENGV